MNQVYFLQNFWEKKKILSSPEVIDSLTVEMPVVPVSYYAGGIQCQVVSKYFASTEFLFSQIKLGQGLWGGHHGLS